MGSYLRRSEGHHHPALVCAAAPLSAELARAVFMEHLTIYNQSSLSHSGGRPDAHFVGYEKPG